MDRPYVRSPCTQTSTRIRRLTMEKEFVPYELALELKQLGFDEPCLAAFNDSKQFRINSESRNWNDNLVNGDTTSSPTYSQAFRWFREKYNMNHSIILHETTFSNDYQYLVLSNDNEFVEVGYTSYEEAELACLQKLIEIVKTK
jgi:hypothetical protein